MFPHTASRGETKVCTSQKMPKYLKQKVHPTCACASLHIQQYEYRKPPGCGNILFCTALVYKTVCHEHRNKHLTFLPPGPYWGHHTRNTLLPIRAATSKSPL